MAYPSSSGGDKPWSSGVPRLPDRRPEVYAVPAIAGVILAVWIVSELGTYVVGLWN